jgi:hypothetical protein
MLTYDIDDLSDAPVNIEVRVGSRLPGVLYINGDHTGAVTSDLKTSLTIEEIGNKELLPTSLVYVGSALSQSQLIEGRRGLAARMREASPGVLVRTFEDAKRWVMGKASTKKDFSHHQTYESHAQVDRVIGAEAIDLDGAGIMGYGWKPKSPIGLVRVKVVVPAWSAEPTSVVAALFVNQSVVPAKFASQELTPGKVGEAVLEFEMAAGSNEAMGLEVRVGPGRPGVIYLNGNENGPDPDMPKPTLTIEEYQPFWH